MVAPAIVPIIAPVIEAPVVVAAKPPPPEDNRREKEANRDRREAHPSQSSSSRTRDRDDNHRSSSGSRRRHSPPSRDRHQDKYSGSLFVRPNSIRHEPFERVFSSLYYLHMYICHRIGSLYAK